jgi:ubiquinone/menaquinone biosynthesis C-methylase UbiE
MSRSWYERKILPHILDFACGMKIAQEQRQKVVPLAQGDVLEIGVGTGLNLPFYRSSNIKRLVGVDPAVEMQAKALRRMKAAGLNMEIIGLSAESLPLADRSFDTVVCTYTLCSIPDPVAAVREMRRVLRPDGRLLFSEHGMAPDEAVRVWQRRLQPMWGRIAGGCQLGLDIPALLVAGGFRAQVNSAYLEGPKFGAYQYWGEAVASA